MAAFSGRSTSFVGGRDVSRAAVLGIYILLSILVAGAFGALHNQLSYTVSPEYFTHFKFIQFGLLNSPLPERLRASEVGFLASWWMGIPLGILTGLCGYIQRGAEDMRRALCGAMLVVLLVVATSSLVGLCYGFLRTKHFDVGDYSGWFVPEGLSNLRAFLCAGYMHNASYLGGLIAVPGALVFHLIYRARRRHAA